MVKVINSDLYTVLWEKKEKINLKVQTASGQTSKQKKQGEGDTKQISIRFGFIN